ncbi:MAG: hypothetical protein M3O15_11860, partial [Acidobacteriota bacterium]|nr:hypothetical protein [Acidobacteriota bacterium]
QGITGFAAFGFIVPFVLDPAAPQRLWMGGDAMWRSDDGAAHWQPASTLLGGRQASQPLVTAIAVAPRFSGAVGGPAAGAVLAGTTTGAIYRTASGALADGGTVWPAAQPREGYVSSVAFDPADPMVAYAAYSNFGGTHLWKTSDGGVSWSGLDGMGTASLPDVPVHVVAVDPRATRHLYLGTDMGVFVSLDGGASWAVESTGFPNAVTESLVVAPLPGGEVDLFAFTHGRGAWKVVLPAP